MWTFVPRHYCNLIRPELLSFITTAAARSSFGGSFCLKTQCSLTATMYTIATMRRGKETVSKDKSVIDIMDPKRPCNLIAHLYHLDGV